MNNTSRVLWIVILVVVVIGLGYFFMPKNTQVVCTQEVKVCADGSSVGRSGPKCEFAACPQVGWKTITDSKTGISYQYPENLTTKYISIVDWPPMIQELDQPFTCTEGGSEIARAGQTTQQTINGTTYCVTKESEGAAGSIYVNYAYAFARNNKTDILTFSLRFVQCANYEEPNKTACDTERASFTPDYILDQIAKSIISK